MRKYGIIYEYEVKRRFYEDSDGTCEMVTDMSKVIVAQRTELDTLKDKVVQLQNDLVHAASAAAHLRGYQERVIALDRPQAEPERRRGIPDHGRFKEAR